MQRINTSNKDPDLFGTGKAGFQAGNPASGVKATFNSMLQDNAIQEELAALPEFAGLALDTALTVAGQDNAQNLKALYLVLLKQLMTSTTTAGTAPVFTATINSPVTLPLVAGLRFRAKFHAATTAASTLNLNALGAKSIKQYDSTGAKVTAVLAANMLTDVEYDGVDWVVRNPINTDAAYSVELQKQTYSSFTTVGTSPAYTATMTPAPAALAAGLRGRAKIHAAATAASTLDLNALGAKSIKQYDSSGAKVAAILAANMLVDLEFDGVDWVVLDPVVPARGMARFTTSGSFTVPPNVFSLAVTACAGGGGGGGGAGTSGQSTGVGGGGGGGGGAGRSIIKVVYAVTPGLVIPITVGGAGTAGIGATSAGIATGTSGGSGGSTVVGSLVTLLGGGGGALGGWSTGDTSPTGGGSGASGGAGYPSGSVGGDGNYAGYGGVGASSPFGGGGGSGRGGVSAGVVGSAAVGFGGGGGGGGGAYGAVAGPGGSGGVGAAGFVLIEW